MTDMKTRLLIQAWIQKSNGEDTATAADLMDAATDAPGQQPMREAAARILRRKEVIRA